MRLLLIPTVMPIEQSLALTLASERGLQSAGAVQVWRQRTNSNARDRGALLRNEFRVPAPQNNRRQS